PADALGQTVDDVLENPRRRQRDRGGRKYAEESGHVGSLSPPDVRHKALERLQHGGSITMRLLTKTATPRLFRTFIAIAGAVIACAACRALAQDRSSAVIGERYGVEGSLSLWNPSVSGVISSDQFGIVGSDIDFNTDLKFEQTKFRDLRFVLRPA